MQLGLIRVGGSGLCGEGPPEHTRLGAPMRQKNVRRSAEAGG
jgi:hypothetical protein